MKDDRDPTIALRDLWALYVSGGFDDGTALELLGHPTPAVRRWAIRLLGDDRRTNSELESKLVGLAVSESESSVRSQLASSCQRLRLHDALPILERLMRHNEDASDTHIPNLIWWGFERQLQSDRPAVVTLLCNWNMPQAPLFRFVLERTARVLASDGTTDDFALVAHLLAAAPTGEIATPIVTGLDLGMDGRRLQQAPPALTPSLDRLWKSSASALRESP